MLLNQGESGSSLRKIDLVRTNCTTPRTTNDLPTIHIPMKFLDVPPVRVISCHLTSLNRDSDSIRTAMWCCWTPWSNHVWSVWQLKNHMYGSKIQFPARHPGKVKSFCQIIFRTSPALTYGHFILLFVIHCYVSSPLEKETNPTLVIRPILMGRINEVVEALTMDTVMATGVRFQSRGRCWGYLLREFSFDYYNI